MWRRDSPLGCHNLKILRYNSIKLIRDIYYMTNAPALPYSTDQIIDSAMSGWTFGAGPTRADGAAWKTGYCWRLPKTERPASTLRRSRCLASAGNVSPSTPSSAAWKTRRPGLTWLLSVWLVDPLSPALLRRPTDRRHHGPVPARRRLPGP